MYFLFIQYKYLEIPAIYTLQDENIPYFHIRAFIQFIIIYCSVRVGQLELPTTLLLTITFLNSTGTVVSKSSQSDLDFHFVSLCC